MQPLISIIIPVYNVEKYLKKCLTSVAEQTYKNLEVILIDDGSTDGSGKICDDFKNEDERAVVIHKKNGGLSGARNAGIDKANGEFLMFVDSDDYIDKTMTEKLYKAVCKYNAEIALCPPLPIDESGKEVTSHQAFGVDLGEGLLSGEDMLRCIYSKYQVISVIACAKLYKREVFKSLRYPENILHEDYCVMHKIYKPKTRVATIAEPLYFYVQHEGSIMSAYSIKRLGSVHGSYAIAKECEKNALFEVIPKTERIAANSLRMSYKRTGGKYKKEKKEAFKLYVKLHALSKKYGYNTKKIFFMVIFFRIFAIPYKTAAKLLKKA